MQDSKTSQNFQSSAEVAFAQACAAGDREAQRQFFREFSTQLMRFFGNRVSRSIAEDLTNDTFVRLFERGLCNYTGKGRLRSFVLGVAYRRLLEHFREGADGRGTVAVEESAVADRRPSPSRIAAQHERRHTLRAVLLALPPDSQRLLELYYWDRLTTSEVAEVLERPVGTVRSQIGRARVLLERGLRDIGFDEADWLEISTTGPVH